jgi:hypothetical protein
MQWYLPPTWTYDSKRDRRPKLIGLEKSKRMQMVEKEKHQCVGFRTQRCELQKVHMCWGRRGLVTGDCDGLGDFTWLRIPRAAISETSQCCQVPSPIPCSIKLLFPEVSRVALALRKKASAPWALIPPLPAPMVAPPCPASSPSARAVCRGYLPYQEL